MCTCTCTCENVHVHVHVHVYVYVSMSVYVYMKHLLLTHLGAFVLILLILLHHLLLHPLQPALGMGVHHLHKVQRLQYVTYVSAFHANRDLLHGKRDPLHGKRDLQRVANLEDHLRHCQLVSWLRLHTCVTTKHTNMA